MNKEPDFYDLDKNRLDEEWVTQVRLYYKHATELADTRQEHERAKADRDLVEAELDLAIRRNPEAHGLEKVTESAVESTIVNSPKYQKAVQVVANTKHAMDVCLVAVDTLDHRKKALEDLVRLRLAEYYSEPRAPEGTREQMGNAKADAAFGKRSKRG